MARLVLAALALVCVVLPAARAAMGQYRPVIGILSQPMSDEMLAARGLSPADDGTTLAYIAESYVKWVEQGGAQVAPVFYNQTTAELTALFGQLNGLLLPGGGAPLHDSYVNALNTIWSHATTTSDYWPLWGTCQGFQQISELAAANQSILAYVDSDNVSMPLDLAAGAESSRMLSALSADALKSISSLPVTMNNHHWGVTPTAYQAQVAYMFELVSTNTGLNGVPFVSTMEATSRPIYATQWHPEKNQFEWNYYETTPHDPAGILVMQQMSNFLVAEARKSTNTFASAAAAQDVLIYQYPTVYTFPVENDFETEYQWSLIDG